LLLLRVHAVRSTLQVKQVHGKVLQRIVADSGQDERGWFQQLDHHQVLLRVSNPAEELEDGQDTFVLAGA